MEKSSTEIVTDAMHKLQFCTASEDEPYMKYYTPQPGDLIIDAGAHVGIYTSKFSKLVGELGKVIAIEPDYRAIGLLELNTEHLQRQHHNIIVQPYVLWNEDTIIQFNVLRPAIGVSSVIVEYRPDVSDKYPVMAYRLQTILKNLGITKDVDYLKMDIESSEIHALNGMKSMLLEKKIKNLTIAAYHRINPMDITPESDRTFPFVEKILQECGYKTKTEVGHDGELVYANLTGF